MVDVQKRHLAVFLPQNKENRVEEVGHFQQIKYVRYVQDLRADVRVIIARLRDAEQAEIRLTLRIVARLFVNQKQR